MKGTVQAAEADAFCETVNIGTGRRTSVLDLLRAIELLVGHPVTRRRLEPRAGDVRDFEADIARARRVLGYEPAVSLEEGLRRRVEFFRVRTSGATP